MLDLLSNKKCRGSGGAAPVLGLVLSIPEDKTARAYLKIRPIDAASLPRAVLCGPQSAPDSDSPKAALRDPGLYVIVVGPTQHAAGADVRYVARIASPELIAESFAADGRITGVRQAARSGVVAARFPYYSGGRLVIARTSPGGRVSEVLCDALLPEPPGDLGRLRISGDCPP